MSLRIGDTVREFVRVYLCIRTTPFTDHRSQDMADDDGDGWWHTEDCRIQETTQTPNLNGFLEGLTILLPLALSGC